jgi:DNA replication protein DnaC
MIYDDIKLKLKNLKLNGLLQSFNDVVELKKEQQWPHVFLHLLKNEESYRKTRSFMYRLELSKLPQIKSLDSFETKTLPINTKTLAHVSTMKFVEDHHNVFIIGESGSGKTHLAIGLANLALQNNSRIRFYKLVDLARELMIAQANNHTKAFMAKLLRFDLILIDEFGYLQIDPKIGPVLFELFSNLYEKVSVIIATHLVFDEWVDIFGNIKITKIIIDRFTHHCSVLDTGKISWRLKEVKNKKNTKT